MKKLLLSVASAIIALAAPAQNRAIDALVEKYGTAEGFTIVNLEGEAIKGLGSMISGNGNISLDSGESYRMSQLLEEVSSVVVIVSEKADELFAREVKNAVDGGKYSPILSTTTGEERITISSAEIKRGRFRGDKEIVLTIAGKDKSLVLVRVIGRIDTAILAKVAEDIRK